MIGLAVAGGLRAGRRWLETRQSRQEKILTGVIEMPFFPTCYCGDDVVKFLSCMETKESFESCETLFINLKKCMKRKELLAGWNKRPMLPPSF